MYFISVTWIKNDCVLSNLKMTCILQTPVVAYYKQANCTALLLTNASYEAQSYHIYPMRNKRCWKLKFVASIWISFASWRFLWQYFSRFRCWMTSQLDSLILGFRWANLRRSLSYMPVSRSALLFIHLFKILYCESLEFVDLKKM